jgi:hypothetical protein
MLKKYGKTETENQHLFYLEILTKRKLKIIDNFFPSNCEIRGSLMSDCACFNQRLLETWPQHPL